MKRMKKSMGLFAAAFVVCMAFAFGVKVNAQTDVTKDNFKITSASGDSIYVEVNKPVDTDYMQVVLCDYKGTPITYELTGGIPVAFTNLEANQVYLIKCRSYSFENGENVYQKTWTDYRAATLLDMNKVSLSLVKNNKNRTVKVKLPKIAGVKQYTVSLSTKKDSGFKKVKTVKAGKAVKITKYNGNKLKLAKKYYLRLQPALTSGVVNENTLRKSFKIKSVKK